MATIKGWEALREFEHDSSMKFISEDGSIIGADCYGGMVFLGKDGEPNGDIPIDYLIDVTWEKYFV